MIQPSDDQCASNWNHQLGTNAWQHALDVSLLLGVFCFLSGLFFFPSWAGYKIALHTFLFLPALLAVLTDPNFRQLLYRSHAFAWLLALLAWAALTIKLANGADALREYKGLLYQLFFVVGILACYHRQPRLFHQLLLISAILAAASAAYAVINFYLIQGRPYTTRLSGYGLLQHAILSTFVYGFYTVVALSTLTANNQSKWLKTIMMLCASIISIYLLATHTRGALVSLTTYVIFLCVTQRGKLSLVYAAGFALVILSVLYLNSSMLLSRGLSHRPELWAAGIQEALSNLWTGTSPGSPHVLNIGHNREFDHPHNMYIQLILDVGLIGGMLYFAIFFCILKTFFQQSLNPERLLFLGLLLYAAVASLFDGDGPFVRPRAVWFISWLPLSLALASTLQPLTGKSEKRLLNTAE